MKDLNKFLIKEIFQMQSMHYVSAKWKVVIYSDHP